MEGVLDNAYYKVRNLLGLEKNRELYRFKEELEVKYGRWYDDPKMDPWSGSFDMKARQEMEDRIVDEFIGVAPGGLSISWNNVSAEVPLEEVKGLDTVWTSFKRPVMSTARLASCTEKHERRHTVISNMSGYVEGGEIVLIQAPPGGGASSFMKLISGKTELFKDVSGEVLYNGENIWDKDIMRLYKHSLQTVEQEDQHYPMLTVRETLSFAASCGIPDFMPYAEVMRQHRVEVVARALGIGHTLDTPVGDASLRGVSGGERKRVTIAEAICSTLGSLFFMDNISKGLDAATTLDICRSIQDFARQYNAIVFVSLQQIGNEAFELFDKVLLLDQGKTIYFGPTEKIEGYFESLGFQRPASRSMADFILSVSDPGMSESVANPARLNDIPKNVDEFVEKYESSEIFAEIEARLEKGVCGSAGKIVDLDEDIKRVLREDCLLNSRAQFVTLLTRFSRMTWDRTTVILTVAIQVVLALIVGTLFLQLPLNSTGAFIRASVLFLAAVYYSISTGAVVAKSFYSLPIYLKQKEAGYYQSLPFHFAGIVDAFSLNLPVVFIFSTIIYFMVGLNLADSGLRFAYFYFMMLTLVTNLELMGRLVSTLFSTDQGALNIVNFVVIAFTVYSGFLIPLARVRPYFVWIYWISPLQYCFRGLAYNEFVGLEFTCSEDELIPAGNSNIPVEDRRCPVESGESYIENNYQFPPGVNWTGYALIYIWGVSFLYLIGIVLLANRQKYRWRKKTIVKFENVDKTAAVEVDAIADSVEESLTEQRNFQQAWLTWNGINYFVDYKGEKKQLLRDVSGYAVPGKLCALMGSSGAGKTTLMDVLARRKTAGDISGEILVNGFAQGMSFGRMSGYVEQMDIHVSKTTVREAIKFSAKLRIGHEFDEEQRNELVENTIDLLELREIQNDLVGEIGGKAGLSSDQRKRLTIAVELVTQPSVLFLDEPTSGLDSRAALRVISALRRVANTGCAVLCTIHQPAKEVFLAFDSLLLLHRGGKTVYFGELGDKASKLTTYFEGNGARPIKPGSNPADYMLEQIGAGVSKITEGDETDWPEVWNQSSERAAVLDALVPAGDMKDGHPALLPSGLNEIAYSSEYAKGFWTQTFENGKRFLISYWRTPEFNFVRILSTVAQALLLGLSFLQVTDTQTGAQVLVSAAFMGGLTADISLNAAVPNVIRERVVYYREVASKTYSASSYYIPLILADQPFNFTCQILFATIFYFMVGFRSSGYPFFLLLSLIYGSWAFATGAMFGSISPSVDIGLLITPLAMSILSLMSGFLIPRASIPGYYIWIYWINPAAYYLSGVVKDVLTDLPFRCEESELQSFTLPSDYSSCTEIPGGTYLDSSVSGECLFCPITNGNQVLAGFTVPDYNMWVSVGALIGFTLLARTVGLLGFKYLRFLNR
eukprot:CAMPEP_0184740756 /NCGR_PEP_ID=MMETSP0315-20130426/3753_1 /TAXON_ID=101924 /ORGANISM="Rhodosorus marinus, Strain UTEX LB 2760" /LENGTH=1400 /DNA_ID=CAMNT_0027210617 /DNA_START=206 /DNA_END=4408 /DNA_ORIENTATION=+